MAAAAKVQQQHANIIELGHVVSLRELCSWGPILLAHPAMQ